MNLYLVSLFALRGEEPFDSFVVSALSSVHASEMIITEEQPHYLTTLRVWDINEEEAIDFIKDGATDLRQSNE